MRPWRVLILLILLGIDAATGAMAQATAVLRFDGHADVSALPFAQVLEDPSGTLTLQQASGSESSWRAAPKDALNFGFSKSAWWVRVPIQNVSKRSIDAVLSLETVRQDYVTWFVLRRNGAFLEQADGGDRVPYAHRPLPTGTLALPIALTAGERVDVFMRFRSYDGLFETMPLRLMNRVSFFDLRATENYILALYHGGILALALYNLLLFAATRGRAFGWYVLHLLCFAAWSLTLSGFSFQLLWPNSPAFNNDFSNVAAAWTFASLGCFTLAYLRLRESAPKWVFASVYALTAANVLAAIPALLGQSAWSAGTALFSGATLALTSLSTAVWLMCRGSRQARFYVIAFSVLGVGFAAHMLEFMSILRSNWFTTWGVQIGSEIQVLLLAFGLADSMNTLKAQKIEAERRAREAQEALAVRLKQEVTERTEALELANRRLHDLAITDELTGAFNRRHFSAFCGAALTHRDRNEPLAFCIFDIDFFKLYNERYGHEAGNDVLRAISQAMRRKLRRSADVLFRLGGEEFGILFTASSAEAARSFVDQLRAAIRELNIAHDGNPAGIVTASFGVGWWDVGMTSQLTPNQMYAIADNMMYEAKDAGRDRVALDAHYENAATDRAANDS